MMGPVKLQNTRIFGININPMLDWANSPIVEILIDRQIKVSKENVFKRSGGGLYWWQDASDGYTRFFYHKGDISKIGDHHYETTYDSGFGGSTFGIRTIIDGEDCLLDLRGPWSSNCDSANQYLPDPCINVTFLVDNGGRFGGHLSVAMVNKLLHHFGLMPKWHVELTASLHPVVMFRDTAKSGWTKQQKEELQTNG
jgi:hypothetical protein